MSTHIKDWKERLAPSGELFTSLSTYKGHQAREYARDQEIADLRHVLAQKEVAAADDNECKPCNGMGIQDGIGDICFMCHGTGKHALAVAIPAGVEAPPLQMIDCQQCKPIAAHAENIRERVHRKGISIGDPPCGVGSAFIEIASIDSPEFRNLVDCYVRFFSTDESPDIGMGYWKAIVAHADSYAAELARALIAAQESE